MDLDTLYRIFRRSSGVTTDSRKCAAGSLFFALKGDTFDGNTFAAKALDGGCAYAVVDNPAVVPQGDARYLLVDNTLQALQQLARTHRRAMGTPIIGITGTNGKTTTKELMSAVLAQKYCLLHTEGNLNNAIGVPLTLLRLRPEHTLAVVEMGASHPGDIKELVEMAEPDYGIVTNVGKAHLQGFGSLEGVIKTKGELFDYLRGKGGATVFVHDDSPYLKDMAHGLTQVLYGSREGLYVSGRSLGCAPYLNLEWQAEDETGTPHEVHTHLIGDYNLPNVLAAIAIGRYFGVEAEAACRALEGYLPSNNRSQLKRTEKNTLIIDAYNANPTSMGAAIDNFSHMQAEGKVLILGDMRELGADSATEHRKIVDRLARERGFDRVILVGEQFGIANQGRYPHYPDTQALIAALQADCPTGKTILIKGSNSLKLASVADYL